VVASEFEVPGWKLKKVVDVTSDVGTICTLYLYVRP
jgi:hypothetical protein